MSRAGGIAISVLDLAPIVQGASIAQAFENSVALARHAESLGYTRFWLAEHHNIAGIASSATSVLIGHIAGKTSTIRVGSGGIMLPNHAPLVIAEQFGTLETLYPGRIDLGLGRAPGTDQRTLAALGRDRSAGLQFPNLLDELRFFLSPARPDQPMRAIPGAGLNIPIWLLGSSDFSARLAAKLGLPFSFAGHFSPEGMAAMRLYRHLFQPSETLQEPYAMIGVPIVAADTDAQAQRLATTAQQKFLSMVRGTRQPLQPPVDTLEGIWSPMEKSAVFERLGAAIVGGPDTVAEKLDALIAETGANEVMVITDAYHLEDRLHSYSLVASITGHGASVAALDRATSAA
ncbi:MAG: LLM class flavin-dependent oxidoreductase [Burkholderiaceae bacterium]